MAIPEAEALRSDGTRSPARSQSPSRRSRRLRSPGRAVSPTFANSTFDAVAGSLQKRQLQVQELRAKLEASQDAGTNLRKQLAETENQVRLKVFKSKYSPQTLFDQTYGWHFEVLRTKILGRERGHLIMALTYYSYFLPRNLF